MCCFLVDLITLQSNAPIVLNQPVDALTVNYFPLRKYANDERSGVVTFRDRHSPWQSVVASRVIEGVFVLPGVPKGALNVYEITHTHIRISLVDGAIAIIISARKPVGPRLE